MYSLRYNTEEEAKLLQASPSQQKTDHCANHGNIVIRSGDLGSLQSSVRPQRMVYNAIEEDTKIIDPAVQKRCKPVPGAKSAACC